MKRIFLYLAVAFVAVITASLTLSKPIVATAESTDSALREPTVTTIRSATTTTLRAQRVRNPSTTLSPSTTTPPDTTRPSINSFTSASPSPTSSPVVYTLVFNENVTSVGASDFINLGTADFCSFAVSGSGVTWSVTVSGCVDGTITPRFNAYGAVDLAGNTGPATSVSATTTITAPGDTTAPTVTAFSSSSDTTVDAFEAVVYTITFSEWVNGVSLSDFSNAGTAKGCSFSGAGTGITWTMTVSGCAGGTIEPQFAADGATDRSGNTGPDTAATATTVITAGAETVPPTVLSFSTVSISPTSQDIVYTIVFSEDVTGVSAGDFTNVGQAIDCSFSVSGSGDRRSVTASDCRRGTVIPRLAANSIEDLSGNVGPTAPATATVTIFALPETTPPAVTSFTSANGPTVAAEASVTYTLVFSESVNGVTPVDFTNTGSAENCAFSASGSGSSRTITVSGCIGGTIIPRFAANGAFDLANNEGPTEAAVATTAITALGTPPTTTTTTTTTTVPSAYPPSTTIAPSTTVAPTTTVVRNSTTTTLRPVRIRIR